MNRVSALSVLSNAVLVFAELGLLVREVHLELPRVDPLRRGHVNAPAQQFELELDLLIRSE